MRFKLPKKDPPAPYSEPESNSTNGKCVEGFDTRIVVTIRKNDLSVERNRKEGKRKKWGWDIGTLGHNPERGHTTYASVYWDDHRLVGRGLYGKCREPCGEGIWILPHDADKLHQPWLLACLWYQVRGTVRACRKYDVVYGGAKLELGKVAGVELGWRPSKLEEWLGVKQIFSASTMSMGVQKGGEISPCSVM